MNAEAEIRQEIRDAGWHAAKDSRIITILIDSLSFLFVGQGLWDQAEELETQAMETRKRMLGTEHPDTLITMANLALTHMNRGRWKEAKELEVQVLEPRKRVLGTQHPDTLTSVSSLALVLQDQWKYDEAGKMYQRACDGFRRTLGPDHPKTIACLNNYSAMQTKMPPLKSVADVQTIPAPTDSGYASMAQRKSVPVFDTSQTGIDVIAEALDLPDTNLAVEFEHLVDQEHVIPKFGLYTAPTAYSSSETSTLPLPRDEEYISQLALDLFSSVKSYESDRNTLERISSKLPDLLRAFVLKVGHKAQSQMHQDISVFVHKYRR